ncbi:MAG: hypothetical protein MPK62_13475 [Alphaproteobacteria bacterium]|nr:hypothetical protein [Alphaproteobacteria bacterium]
MPEYSLEEITSDDFDRLAEIALNYYKEKGYPAPLLICLCQGAALHYAYGKLKRGGGFDFDAHRVKKMVGKAKRYQRGPGVKDFDVWSFFLHKNETDWDCPYRGTRSREFGESKFGKDPTGSKFEWRKADIFGRSIVPSALKRKPEVAVVDWLANSRNPSPTKLRNKPAVIIWPKRKQGTIIWPLK